MSHSNTGEGVGSQTTTETMRDEAHHASVTFFRGERKTCFFDDQPATVLLNGLYLCTSHAICATCLKPLTNVGVTCRCDQCGYLGHEELLWCSARCVEARHPDPDRDDHGEGE